MRKLIIVSLVVILGVQSSCSRFEEEIDIPSPTTITMPSLTPMIELPLTATATQGPTDSLAVASVPPASPTPAPPDRGICSPLADHTLKQLPEIVSQPYDPPPPGRDERHHGVDFAYYNHAGRASIEGEGVQAIMAGRVAAAIHDRLPYGNMVIIETPNELLTDEIFETVEIPAGHSIYHLYAHLGQTPLVELGQQVKCGQVLGDVGKTGYFVPVAHLHLETRSGPPGVIFESMAFFDTLATPEEQAAYTRWRISGEFEHFDPMRSLNLLP